ncbi:hypothetical protein EG329_001151 [Mollisiaceae sp. DMI_Dod_QoI]|nr:hypothetical protein EG329_001151 [Helotiales sp. DMI_Dod_QoI]
MADKVDEPIRTSSNKKPLSKIMEGDLAHEIIPSTCLPDTENPQGILQDHIFVGQQSHLQKSHEHSPADQHCEPDRQAWSITPM